MTVLVLARDLDPQIDRVVEELADRDIPVFRTDLSAFPRTLTLESWLGPDGWDGELATPHRSVRLSDVHAVWYRHPSHFTFPDGLSRPERRHAATEARCGIGGILARLDALWVNYPSREADAVKPAQLQVARQCGLHVPGEPGHQPARRRPGVRRQHRGGRSRSRTSPPQRSPKPAVSRWRSPAASTPTNSTT